MEPGRRGIALRASGFALSARALCNSSVSGEILEQGMKSVTKAELIAKNSALSAENAALRAELSQARADIERLRSTQPAMSERAALRAQLKALCVRFNALGRITSDGAIELYSKARREWRVVPAEFLG